MNSPLNPKTVHKPLGTYSHTVRVPADADWLAISGQVGIDKNGRLAAGIKKQSEQALRNLLACLRANGMGKGDLVKVTSFLTDPRHTEAYRTARNRILGGETTPGLNVGSRRWPGDAGSVGRSRSLGG